MLSSNAQAENFKKEPTVTHASQVKWMPMVPELGDKGPQMAVVFGDLAAKGKPIGVLVKIPAGTVATPHTHSSDYWSVVIKGQESNFDGDASNAKPLPVGSWWYQPGKDPHDNKCFEGEDCILFTYYEKGMDISFLNSQVKTKNR